MGAERLTLSAMRLKLVTPSASMHASFMDLLVIQTLQAAIIVALLFAFVATTLRTVTVRARRQSLRQKWTLLTVSFMATVWLALLFPGSGPRSERIYHEHNRDMSQPAG